MLEKVFLKRYASRRLYDTESSSYVTLGQVSDMIRGGRQVQVVHAKINEDVTAFILTQIILEEARKQNSLLPVSLLHLFIQYGDNVLSEFFENYLELTIRNYLAHKAAFDQQFRSWLDVGKDIFAPGQLPLPPLGLSTPSSTCFRSPRQSRTRNRRKSNGAGNHRFEKFFTAEHAGIAERTNVVQKNLCVFGALGGEFPASHRMRRPKEA